LAHITGGGITENLPRVLPDGLGADIDLGAWTAPPVFGWLATAARLDAHEMLRTFNCGVGMILVVGADAAVSVTAKLAASGETAFEIGRIVTREGGVADRVRYAGTPEFAT